MHLLEQKTTSQFARVIVVRFAKIKNHRQNWEMQNQTEEWSCAFAASHEYNYKSYINIILPILLIVFTLITNSMLIHGLYKTNRRFTISQKLFIALSINDILSLVTALMIQILFKIKRVSCNDTIIFLNWNTACLLTGVKLFGLISGLRFISIKWPFQRISQRLVYFMCAAILVLSYSWAALF